MPAANTAALFADTVTLTYSDIGSGRPHLLLHGGAGPASMVGLAAALARTGRAIAPIHPGFAGTGRPGWFARVDYLALAYLELIQRMDLRDVVLIGNSVGGWIAAEMALRQSPRIAGVVLLNAVGIDTGSLEKKIVNPSELPIEQRAGYSFHDPAKFAFAPAGPDAAAAMAANQATLAAYAGKPFMHDPSLRERLANIAVPTVVGWGTSDRIVDLDYGRRFAAAISGSRFEPIAEAGHFPHIEQLDAVLKLIGSV